MQEVADRLRSTLGAMLPEIAPAASGNPPPDLEGGGREGGRADFVSSLEELKEIEKTLARVHVQRRAAEVAKENARLQQVLASGGGGGGVREEEEEGLCYQKHPRRLQREQESAGGDLTWAGLITNAFVGANFNGMAEEEMWPLTDGVRGDVVRGDVVPLESCGEEEIVGSILFP